MNTDDRERILARFLAKVNKTDTCWLWTGGKCDDGYGVFQGRRGRRAHRFAYEALVGPIPPGLTIDHLCRVRHCVNPAHMEPVTNRENVLRGEGLTAREARQTHCKRGHEFTPENTWRRLRGASWARECRACSREKEKRRPQRDRRLYDRDRWVRRAAAIRALTPPAASSRGGEPA